MFICHNAKFLKQHHIEEEFGKIKEFTVSETQVIYNETVIVDLDQFDKKYSYLVDYFKDARGKYLIISEVSSNELQSSSDFNTLSRKKLFICDLSTRKKYTYNYTSSSSGLILPKRYYETLRYGITIKSIDTVKKLLVFEKDMNSVNTIKVPMVEVTSF
ncbi:hypothetical protein [uncultured Kordia sp.]|uniref:hypothetical protein n=1 Tax=uncultured Kordia sp. TaxID=507699 RepID=UPI0026104AB1|nr:hypothetical protein [uncultured Kordia sp.]